MNDTQLRDAYARWLAERSAAGREGCVSPDALLALVERQGTEEQRLATLDHAMRCDACRRDLELLRSVAAAGERPALAAGAVWTSPAFRLAASVAFIVALAGAGFLVSRPDSDTMRGEPAVVTVSPSGSVSLQEASRMVWRSVPDARRYDVEIMTNQGYVVHGRSVPDTTLVIPSGTLAPGSDYLWIVRAFRSDGTQVVATPRRFRITE